MKKFGAMRVTLVLTAFLVGFSLLVGKGAPAAEKTITWRCQAAIALASPTYKESVVRVADRIKELTKGRLVIEHHPAGALLPTKEIFPALKRGMIQIGYVTPSYWKTDLPLSLCCALPFAFTNYWEVLYFHNVLGFEKMLVKEQAKHDVLFWSDHVIPVELVMKEPIKSIDDFKGKKIRTYGQFGRFFSMLGAQPVSAPGPEIYTGLATGVFQAAHWGAAVGAESLALYEVCKYHLKPSISLGTEEGWLVNKKAFEGLPKDIQEVVKKVLEDQFWVRSCEYAYNEAKTLGMVQKSKGVKVITLPPEDQKKMAKIAMQVWDDIAKEGPDNPKAVSMLKKFLADIGGL
jgi:TRAP-type C4-dicarboxylate transport system substrate-binding protein